MGNTQWPRRIQHAVLAKRHFRILQYLNGVIIDAAADDSADRRLTYCARLPQGSSILVRISENVDALLIPWVA
jgi:hypothetical protein